MTKKEAYQVLGILPGTEKDEIKKRYRQLMQQVHPDVGAASGKSYAYAVQDINAAYALLVKEKTGRGEEISGEGKGRSRKNKSAAWDAPVNSSAYREREVLQYAEDCDGAVLGSFCIAKGKYLWKPEEDFPLFLLSMYRCSRELLDGIDAEIYQNDAAAMRIQSELTYLLAQQFIDGSALLEKLAKEEGTGPDGQRIFYLSAMLELADKSPAVKTGELLYPSRIAQHRLFLKNQAGRELGYLSFRDDRLYYIVIPLFEQKRVQVKIQAAKKPETGKRKKAGYRDLHLWLRLCSTDGSGLLESLNLRIEQLLEQYRKMCWEF